MSAFPSRPRLSDADFLQDLRESHVGKTIETEAELRLIEERRAHVAAIEAAGRKAEREWPRLTASIDKAVVAMQAAEAAFIAARDQVARAAAARSAAATEHSSARERAEAALRETADPAISGFRAWILGDLDETRRRISTSWDIVEHPVTGSRVMTATTNAPSIRARVAALNAALEECEVLILLPDQGGVAARIAEIRAALPAIGSPERIEPGSK